ncbi:DEAD/DEAH box helicase [Luteococcus sp. Sow4_B9]|uniref:DEAD/DEAH box helicase n=1 Tax=Luteococcus sp. Sow4_B9 TaxID=3438792 RepID=UPI003F9479F7
MKKTTVKLSHHLRDVQERTNLVDQEFSSKTPYSRIPLGELRQGTLGPQRTAELYALRDGASGRVSTSPPASSRSDAKSLDIIISLVTLHQDGRAAALALLPATLAPDGRLTADLASGEPWIPVVRLRSPGSANREVMVGNLSALWKWRNGKGMESASKVESFTDAVDHALAMFDAVSDDDFRSLAASAEYVVDTELCHVVPGKVIKANGAILELYGHLIDGGAALEAPLYEALLCLDQKPRASADSIDDDVELLRESALRAVGSMSDAFPLTASQRRAVHAFERDGEGMATAVSGPPGTGKTTMLQAVVASLLVQHALDGKPAPLVVGTSTNNQAVTNIIDSFSSVTKDDPGILDHRWLPVALDGDAGADPLPGLAVYCPSQAKASKAREKGYLTESTNKSGVYSEYSEDAYRVAATSHFLQKTAQYCTAARLDAPHDLKAATVALRKALKTCDEQRRRLIEERARADSLIGPNDSARLRRELDQVGADLLRHRHFLDQWVARLSPPRPDGSPADPVEDEYRAEMNRQPDEPAGTLQGCGAYVQFYEERSAALGATVDRLQAELDQVVRREEEASRDYRKSSERPLRMARLLGVITQEQVEQILSAASLLELDRLLDTTLRYAQFWLAVHVYEAEWLTVIGSDDLIAPDERSRTVKRYMDRYWSQVPALVPCFVMTAFQLPKYFRLWTRSGEPSNFDLGRIDLLIIDEAGQVDTSVGAAAFALAKRALVVGDVQQLAPVWGIDPEADRELAEGHGLTRDWDEMEKRGLTASSSSSVMRAASAATRWSNGEDEAPGLFLAEHFRCHPDIIGYCNDLLYNGKLVPSRPAESWPLAGRVPAPFLFRQVPGSEDRAQGPSRINEQEANVIVEWIVHNFDFFREIYNPDGDPAEDKKIIGVVTPFAAQARLIERRLEAVGGAQLRRNVTVGTAHTLQGAERSVVLFSAVYGDNSGKASFVDNTLELMNVAVSRAKDLFIVFGGAARAKDRGPVFSLVARHATPSACDFAGARGLTVELPATSGAPGVHEESANNPSMDASGENERSASDTTLTQPTTAEVTSPETVPDGDVDIWVSRHEPGYLIASELIKKWKTDPVAAGRALPNSQQFNRALERAGLLVREDSTLRPSARGATLGIARYESGSGTNRYFNVIYSMAAQQALTAMLVSGEMQWEEA